MQNIAVNTPPLPPVPDAIAEEAKRAEEEQQIERDAIAAAQAGERAPVQTLVVQGRPFELVSVAV